MDRTFTLLVIVLILGGPAQAQMDQSYGFGFRYQGVAFENGQPISQGNIALQLRIREGDEVGPVVYTENWSDVQVQQGQFAITIGGVGATSSTGTLRELDWGGKPYYLETRMSMDNNPGNLVTIGTSEILGAPWLNPVHTLRLSSYSSTNPTYGDMFIRAGDGIAASYHSIYVADGPDSELTRRNFWFMGIGDRHMDVSIDGNLSVGQLTIPENMTHEFEVVGSACKSAGGTSWAVCSDPRIKRNIRTLDLGLETLEKIHPIWFEYDTDKAPEFDDKQRLGLNADEIASIPELRDLMVEVHPKYGIPDLKMIQSSEALMYISVNAIKEQQQELEILKDLVEAQRQMIEDQSKRLDQLESILGSIGQQVIPATVATTDPAN